MIVCAVCGRLSVQPGRCQLIQGGTCIEILSDNEHKCPQATTCSHHFRAIVREIEPSVIMPEEEVSVIGY